MHGRRGVTLVEIAIVVAIIGVLAAIGAAMLNDLIPSWRTRRAALDFAAAAEQARAMAIADNVQYRVYFTESDSDPATGTLNYGEYYVQRGDEPSHTTAWDTLPVDMSGTDNMQEEGHVNIQKDAEDSLPGVSLETPSAALAGVDTWSNSLVYNPRGQLDNPANDFSCDANNDGSNDGYVCVTFVNKKALLAGRTDKWTVLISRAGMTRLQHNDETVGYTAGAAITTSPGSTSSGYAGGSGSSGGGKDTGSPYGAGV